MIMFFEIFILFIAISIFQPPIPTPTSISSMLSVVLGETCSPPCWYGLIAGESRVGDVENILNENKNIFPYLRNDYFRDNIINPETGLLENGEYYVSFSTSDGEVLGYIQIKIENNIATSIFITLQREIELKEILATFGDPDRIEVHASTITSLYLFYFDEQLRIVVNEDDRSSCNLRHLADDYHISTILYYSPEIAELYFHLDDNISSLDDNPYYIMPLNLWYALLNGEVDQGCGYIPRLLGATSSLDQYRTPPPPTIPSFSNP